MRSKRLAAVAILGVALMLGLPMKALANDHHHWHHDFSRWGNHDYGRWSHQGPPPGAYNAARPSYAANGYGRTYNPGYGGYSAPPYNGYAGPAYSGYPSPAYGGYAPQGFGGYSAPGYGGYGAPGYGGYTGVPYGSAAPGCGAGMQHLMQTRSMLGNSIAQANYARNWNQSHRLNTQLEYTNKLINQNGGGAACGQSAGNSGLLQSFMPNRGYTAPINYNRYNSGYNGGFGTAAAYNANGRAPGYNGNGYNGAYGNSGFGSMLAPFIR